MDIWNVHLHEIKHKKKMENIKNNNNILKRYEKSYEEIRNHVLELQRQRRIIYRKL